MRDAGWRSIGESASNDCKEGGVRGVTSIADCYSYQATQEMYEHALIPIILSLTSRSVYQEFLGKGLTEKHTALSGQMDQVIHDANSEITSLRSRLAGRYP